MMRQEVCSPIQVHVQRGTNRINLETMDFILCEMKLYDAMQRMPTNPPFGFHKSCQDVGGRTTAQLVEALEGQRMTDHHRFLIGQSLRHMNYIRN